MMTLRELKTKMKCPVKGRVPGHKALMKQGGKVLARIDFGCSEYMIAFESGYILYRAGGHSTVFSAFSTTAYVYEGSTADITIKEEYFEDCYWYVRLLLEAEDNISHCIDLLQRKVSYDAVSVEWGEIAVDETAEKLYLKKEVLQKLQNVLTEKQLSILDGYFFEGLSLEKIGLTIGMSKQAVRKALNVTLSSCREVLGDEYMAVF